MTDAPTTALPPSADLAGQTTPTIVVLGIGNTLRGDEGVGIHVLQRVLAEHRLGDHVRAIDGGVMGLELLPYLEGCSALLLLDAVDAGLPPGSVVRLEGEAVPAAWEQKLSMHQAGLADLLALLRMEGLMPERLVLLGVQPAIIDWSLDLSPQVVASFDRLVEQVVDQLRSWGALAD
jgi:hydrogenase maturation protease